MAEKIIRAGILEDNALEGMNSYNPRIVEQNLYLTTHPSPKGLIYHSLNTERADKSADDGAVVTKSFEFLYNPDNGLIVLFGTGASVLEYEARNDGIYEFPLKDGGSEKVHIGIFAQGWLRLRSKFSRLPESTTIDDLFNNENAVIKERKVFSVNYIVTPIGPEESFKVDPFEETIRETFHRFNQQFGFEQSKIELHYSIPKRVTNNRSNLRIL